IQQLLLAQNWIESQPDKRKDGVEIIGSLMRGYHRGSDWSRAHYGALAVKASIAEGDLSKAREILHLALQAAPQDAQLQYLDRGIAGAESTSKTEAKSAKVPALATRAKS